MVDILESEMNGSWPSETDFADDEGNGRWKQIPSLRQRLV
jgi:hypothetical protein